MPSKNDENRWSSNSSAFVTSLIKRILLTSARDVRTYLCCVLYALLGSQSAGRMVLTKRENIS